MRDPRVLGLVFPGQGTQRVGAVGRFVRLAPARAVFDLVSDISGTDVIELWGRGPRSKLDDTRYAQPAIFAANGALHAVLADHGIVPDIVAGHSVGELNALVAAGALTLRQGAELVVRRGAEMSRVAERGAMAAIIGLEYDTVLACCEKAAPDGVLVVALLNGVREHVISGTIDAVERGMELARALGAARTIRLATSNAFHSPLMNAAMPAWSAATSEVTFAAPSIPIVMNSTGGVARDAEDVRSALCEQLIQPVRWHDVMLTFVRASVSMVVECGASRVLTALARRANPTWTTVAIDGPAGLNELARAIAATPVRTTR